MYRILLSLLLKSKMKKNCFDHPKPDNTGKNNKKKLLTLL